MDWMTYKERLEDLSKAGCTAIEIERLTYFRRTYRKNEQDQACVDLAHLRFIRWLVANGRLTDQIAP